MDCVLEQRARVLYKQSMEEDRLAKILEIRDFSFVPVSEMLSMLMPLFVKLRPLVGNLQHHYPEMVFKVYIIHAPKAIGAFLDIWKPELASGAEIEYAAVLIDPNGEMTELESGKVN